MKPLAQPRSPKWPYFVGDAALLAAAFAIGAFGASPLSPLAVSCVFGCVALGAVLAALPFLLDFIVAQRAAELELLSAVEAQNTKLHHNAEILAGAAGQLKSAYEAATRAVHSAETLPYRLQEKVSELTAQLQQADDEEKAALEKELEALRETEGERLSAMADKIRAATRELAAVDKEARPALESALTQTREIEKALAHAATQARTTAEQAETRLTTLLDSADVRARQTADVLTAAEARLTARIAELKKLEIAGRTAARRAEAAKAPAESSNPTTAPAAPETTEAEAAKDDRSEETVAAPTTGLPHPVPPIVQLTAFPRVKPDMPLATDREPVEVVSTVVADPAARPPVGEVPASGAGPRRESRRKTAARNVGDSVLPGFAEQQVVYDDIPAPAASAPAKTSDGTTRLHVTAYIGIGNKVFVRGDGPGLSRDKGVPMEFISIGKWAWETTDAVSPLKIQLYKNDELRAQGEDIVLPPGHDVEATPVFREPDPF